jgi:hypothetical protein
MYYIIDIGVQHMNRGKKSANERKLLQECTVCRNVLRVRVLECPNCRTRIEGDFDPPHSRIFYLSHKELEFVELFMRVRGNIKEVEKALGISYPTVRGMLDTVIQKMGYPVKPPVDEKRKADILNQLEKGEIDADKATALLKAEDGEE